MKKTSTEPTTETVETGVCTVSLIDEAKRLIGEQGPIVYGFTSRNVGDALRAARTGKTVAVRGGPLEHVPGLGPADFDRVKKPA